MIAKIPGYDNYLVDDCGHIFSTVNGKLRLKKACNVAHGYQGVQLWKHNKLAMKLVHRLVLEAFVGPCPEGMECCHNDGNKKNNNRRNLRWDTPKNNHQDAVRHGTHAGLIKGEKHGGSKLTDKQVKEIRYLAENTNLYHRQIADKFGVSAPQITRIVNRASRT